MLTSVEVVAAVVLAGSSVAGFTTAAAFEQIVVFGDSLSDSGNAGRFSNGPVWVEQLGTYLGLSVEPSGAGGSNFAVGGARVAPNWGSANMRAQTDMYLSRPPIPGRILHIVFGGGNDLLAAVQAPEAESMVEAAAASLKSIVTDLSQHGATDVLVPNLPDVGMTPAVRRHGERAIEEARKLTDLFNAKLDEALRELASRHKVRFHRLDVRRWRSAREISRQPSAL